MPRGKSGDGGSAKLPPLVNPKLIKGLNYVLRQHILAAAALGPVSPVELSRELEEPLGMVSYHARILHEECEIIELVSRTQVRGAIEHHYRATEKTLLPARAWRGLKKGMRAVIGGGMANDLFEDLAGALKGGKLRGDHDHIVRTPLALDAEGARRVKAIARRATKEVEDEQRAVGARIAKANGDAGRVRGHTFAMLSFETAWEPADLYARATEVKDSASGGKGQQGKGRAKRKRAATK